MNMSEKVVNSGKVQGMLALGTFSGSDIRTHNSLSWSGFNCGAKGQEVSFPNNTKGIVRTKGEVVPPEGRRPASESSNCGISGREGKSSCGQRDSSQGSATFLDEMKESAETP